MEEIMETEGARSGPEEGILEAMEAAEPAEAAAGLSRLAEELHARGIDALNLSPLWNRFKRLLHRRGYFVSTPTQLAASLDEIHAVGEGFDLFDLASSLAHYDAVRTECRGLSERLAIPALRKFARRCVCARLPRKPPGA